MNSALPYIDFHTHQPLDVNCIQIKNWDGEKVVINKYYSFGKHPWHIDNEQYVINNNQLAINSIAIGESGLDKHIKTDFSVQLQHFRADIALAKQLQKPMIIHCVRAYQECLAELKGVTAIFHGFNKNLTLAQQIIQQGHYLSFGKALLHKADTQAAFAALPLDKCVLETDDSDINIAEIYFMAAKIRNIQLEQLILQQHKNFEQLFKLKI